MRKRDMAISMLSGFAIFFTLQVLEPHTRRVDEGFREARVLADITLLPDKIRVASGRRFVAMATGVIDRYYKDKTPQKQVLVVVTSGDERAEEKTEMKMKMIEMIDIYYRGGSKGERKLEYL